jgi:uncharacterized protein YbjT (DUF2867 family)
MRILLCGATGFIGRAAAERLRANGHEVVGAARTPPAGEQWIAVHYSRDHSPEDWIPRLRNIHVVINAVGILREDADARFVDLHERAPIALFRAAVACGIPRVIQISALGADENATSRYHRSKKRADEYLATLPLNWTIVLPSLVYGPGGASARLFDSLASLPLLPLPGGGTQQVQPIHIDDLCEALVRLAEGSDWMREHIAFVGPSALSLREWLSSLRAQMGLPPARVIAVPMPLVRAGAALGGLLGRGLLDPETLAMLERGNTASDARLREVLDRPARDAAHFIPAAHARAAADSARLNWLRPLLRWSVALLWIVTGVLSLGIYPTEESYALLARLEIEGPTAAVMLYGAALLDIALGVAVLILRRRWVWRAQLAIILGYTFLITIFLPEFWLHPFGPILKNIPLLALLVLLHEYERA